MSVHARLAGLAVLFGLALLAFAIDDPRPRHRSPAGTTQDEPGSLVGTPAVGRVLHVDAGGHDEADGTRAAPLRSLQRAADLARAGTTVRVRAGQYEPVLSRRSGTAAARIVFISDPVGAAEIVSPGEDAAWYNHGSHVDIVGFDVTAPRSAQGIISVGSSVRIRGNRVRAVALQEELGAGAGINHAGYDTVQNEVVGNRVSVVGRSGNTQTHGIYVSQEGSLVRDNVVHTVSGWCVHAWHAATRLTVVENTVYDCGTPGAGGGGIVVGAGDSPGGVRLSDTLVARNVIRDSVDGVRVGGRVGDGVRVRDNTVVNSGQ